MSWSKAKKEIDDLLNDVHSNDDFIKKYLSTPLQDRIGQLHEKFAAHLFGDLMEQETHKDIETFLGKSYFNANEYAKACITTAFRSKDVYGVKVQGWTDSALKCFDNFVLALIQDKLNETIKGTSGDKGWERQKYNHLIVKGGNLYDIGMGFDVVYQQRNELTHVEVVDATTGYRKQVRVSNKKIQQLKSIILENFKKALIALEKEI